MARPLRIEYSGALYHITSRGNAKNKIFRTDKDRDNFLEILELVVKRHKCLCHTYCLMENHYHLIVETPEDNLSMGMRQLNGIYTQKFNRTHKSVGHVFQGRYKAILIEKESYLIEICRYVALNPVRAGIVEIPDAWQWSSYAAMAGIKKSPEYLTEDWVLGQFGRNKRSGQSRYKEFVMAGSNKNSPWKELQGQGLLGRDNFIEEFKNLLTMKEEIKEIRREQRYTGRPRLSGIFKEGQTKSRSKRSKKMHKSHTQYGYTLKEIGDYLSLHYTTVSKSIKDIDNNN